MTRIPFKLLAVTLTYLLLAGTPSQAQQTGGVLDFLPAIIAASAGGECDKSNLNRLRANCTLSVDSNTNLNGATINLAARVNIEFAGGSLVNGTLIFNGGSIDGRLLNPDLTIRGNAKLIDPVFEFIPSIWRITEVTSASNPQPPSQAIAFRNRQIIQSTINLVKRLSATTFSIGRMDAFFDSGGARPSTVIEMPSDFHLRMSGQTTIRVFPLARGIPAEPVYIYDKKNVRVSGGNLIGDRLLIPPSNPDSNSLLTIKGGQDIVISGVTMRLASSTGMSINSILFMGDDGFVQSRNIVVQNCVFDSNRNNNFSITDGHNIIIKDSISRRAGIDLQGVFGLSDGRAPRIGIVVEPVLGQRISDITIRNNTIEQTVGGSSGNSILASGGDNFLIENNTSDGNIGWTAASAVKVRNNTLLGGGIIGGFFDAFALSVSRDNEISGNNIRNCATGMDLTNDDIDVFNNTITNCTVGIFLRSLKDTNIYDNRVTSNGDASFGIVGQAFADRVVIRNNNFNIAGRVTSIGGINGEPSQQSYQLEINDNTFTGGNTGRITSSKGVNLNRNIFRGAGMFFGNSSNILFDSNNMRITNGAALGINKNNASKNITISNNTLHQTGGVGLSGYGIRINTVGSSSVVEDTNIVIYNNDIQVTGNNWGINSIEFDGVSITNNSITNINHPGFAFESILFEGNNSTITNNQLSHGANIQGSGNTVSGN